MSYGFPGSFLPSGGVPVVAGEVLFDVFPDGTEILGGAPFNVAWNLQGLGFAPLFLSRVGRDARGEEIRRRMTLWGLRLSGLQVDPDRPTGTVRVALDGGEPSYEIPPDQAWDHLERAPAREALDTVEGSLLYRGTLAGRSRGSAATLRELEGRFPEALFVDVNLRSPWWTAPELRRLAGCARFLKLNEEEAAVLEAADRDDAGSDAPGITAITLGARGARLLGPGGILARRNAPPPDPLVDPVGAGDAFSAVLIAGLQLGWDPERILDRAVEFASRVCSLRGATTDDLSFYARVRGAWEDADGRA